jgi:hypothetical protein
VIRVAYKLPNVVLINPKNNAGRLTGHSLQPLFTLDKVQMIARSKRCRLLLNAALPNGA